MWRQARLECGNSSARSSESHHVHCCESQSRVLAGACRCFTSYLHAKAHRLVLAKLPAEDCSGKDKGNIGLLKKSMYGTRDAARDWERDWQGHPKIEEFTSWGAVQEACSTTRKKKTSGLTHGDDFVVTGSKESLVGAKEATGERVPNQSEHHRGRLGKEYRSAESENPFGRDRDIVSPRSPTR